MTAVFNWRCLFSLFLPFAFFQLCSSLGTKTVLLAKFKFKAKCDRGTLSFKYMIKYLCPWTELWLQGIKCILLTSIICISKSPNIYSRGFIVSWISRLMLTLHTNTLAHNTFSLNRNVRRGDCIGCWNTELESEDLGLENFQIDHQVKKSEWIVSCIQRKKGKFSVTGRTTCQDLYMPVHTD